MTHELERYSRRGFLRTTTEGIAGAAALAGLLNTALPERLSASARAADPAAPAEPAKRPIAYVYEHEDRWSKSVGDAKARLEEAGFEVRPLPLDQSPWELTGLIFLGSFSSEHPGYAEYMRQHAANLFNFVDKGNVLLQMTQADQFEVAPPFLPTTHGARRQDADVAVALVHSPKSRLLAGMVAADAKRGDKFAFAGRRIGWECYAEQEGFEVILCAGEDGKQPILMEGAYGQGRIVLSSLAWDKPGGKDSSPL